MLAVLVSIAGAAPAAAHAGFVSASPAPCDVVTDVVEVVVDFDQPIAAELSDFELVDGDGGLVATGEVVSGSPLGGTLAADLDRPLPPGDYRVAWRNVSVVDSDPGQGEFGFTVGGGDAVAAPGCSHVTGDEAAADAADGGTGAPLLVIVVAGGAAVGAVAVLVALRRRASGAAA